MNQLPHISTTITDVRTQVRTWRQKGLKIGFVPTMGYLHQGHLSLIRLALEHTDKVVVSIFVNPTQFAANEDLDRYPHDIDGDIEKVRQAGGSLIFLPTVETMYPPNAQTFVEVSDVTKPLCGLSRMNHFRGVTTVVTKLFNIVQPDVAVFGRKDYQQLVAIQQMVADLNMPIKVIGGLTIREKDGLAMSSRNVHLSKTERQTALAINQSLRAARQLFASGEKSPSRLLALVSSFLEQYKEIKCEYIELRDSQKLTEIQTEADGSDRLFIAVKLGETRLIDNASLAEDCLLDHLEYPLDSTL